MDIVTKLDNGPAVITLLPSILFFTYFWHLSDTYIKTLMLPNIQQDAPNFPNNETWRYLLQINGYLSSNYTMNQAYMLAFEYVFKMIICYSVVACVRQCYLHITDYYETLCILRITSLHRYFYNNIILMSENSAAKTGNLKDKNNRMPYVYRHNIANDQNNINDDADETAVIDELGVNGQRLMQDIVFPPDTTPVENTNTNQTKLKYTKSCPVNIIAKPPKVTLTKTINDSHNSI
ncbi:Hypothetical protein CINCED_3A010767 [Cinara cedri]|uniref:Uncharacterized protein n=1 Tax=Cinara cedri TaxID=506608 RepID=A0A5E4N3H1_9HEMI|nr:Hypothetical protein CINCED_3A010767 [Cinara cedri]